MKEQSCAAMECYCVEESELHRSFFNSGVIALGLPGEFCENADAFEKTRIVLFPFDFFWEGAC